MRDPAKYAYVEGNEVKGDAVVFMHGRAAAPDGSIGHMAQPGTPSWFMWLRYFDSRNMRAQAASMRSLAASSKPYMVPCQNPKEFDPEWGMSRAALQTKGEKLERYRRRPLQATAGAKQKAVDLLRGSDLARTALDGGFILGLYEFVRDYGRVPDDDELGFIREDGQKVTKFLKDPPDIIRSAADAIRERRAVVAKVLLGVEEEAATTVQEAGERLTFSPAKEAKEEAEASSRRVAHGRWMQNVMVKVKDDPVLSERVFTMLEQAPDVEEEATRREMARPGTGTLYVMGLLLEAAE